MIDEHTKRVALSMTVAIAELEMTAFMLDISGESDLATSLEAVTERIRALRNRFRDLRGTK